MTGEDGILHACTIESGNPEAFLIFTANLIVIVAVQIVLFKKLKWF